MPAKKTKSKSKSKKTTSKKKGAATLPEALSSEDVLRVQLALKEVEAAVLRAQLTQVAAERAVVTREKAQQLLGDLNARLNEQYSVTVGKDRIDPETGTITRG